MVEARQTQVPVGGGEGGRAPEHLLHHEELGTVEDDPGDVTEEEDHDNADEEDLTMRSQWLRLARHKL